MDLQFLAPQFLKSLSALDLDSWSDATARYGKVSAEPDASFASKITGQRTVVIEVQTSPSESQLITTIRHWIEHAHSTIQICITVRLNDDLGTITLSIWHPESSGSPDPRLDILLSLTSICFCFPRTPILPSSNLYYT
ncbi:hypothetical protein PENSTE_c011G04207 [Penicillium steckii]|uniref:Uncharacterized protein n=1 Tax=Penicillium steckii TaxID=303698 RepID=A0A1V6T6V2_9EURO|nr:hypothetical protein PENSTE_c011G04207 [Penicillium steckii]